MTEPQKEKTVSPVFEVPPNISESEHDEGYGDIGTEASLNLGSETEEVPVGKPGKNGSTSKPDGDVESDENGSKSIDPDDKLQLPTFDLGSLFSSIIKTDKTSAPAPVAEKPGADKRPVSQTEKQPAAETDLKKQKPEELLLKKFDQEFPKKLEELNHRIEKAKLQSKTATDSLFSAQASTLNVRARTGQGEAELETAKNAGDKDNITKLESNQAGLKRLDEISEGREKLLLSQIPNEERDFRAVKAVYLISSGTDENVRSGELQLAELVRDNPRLQTDKGFRDLVLNGYSEMTRTRLLRGLPDWNSDLKADEIVKPISADSTQDPKDLIDQASRAFFEKGIGDASPLFKAAITRQAETNQRNDHTRVRLFISSLAYDASIVQAAARDQDDTKQVEARLGNFELEKKAVEESLAGDLLKNSFEINYSFARIASGDKALARDAVKDILTVLVKQPEISLDEGFKDGFRNAFKAHHAATAGDEKPAAKKPEGEENDKPAELKVNYNDLTMTYGNSKKGPEVQAYNVDTATSLGLVMLGLGIAAATMLKGRQRYNQADATKSSQSAAEKVVPIYELVSKAVNYKPAAAAEQTRYNVVGTARDGRVVLTAADAKVPEADPKYRAVKPNPEFKPNELKYGDYTPLSVAGKSYFADKEGTVFEHKNDLLIESNETRKIRLATTEALKDQLAKKPVPADVPVTLLEKPEALLPDNLRRQVEIIKDVKAAMTESGTHGAEKNEQLSRAVRALTELKPDEQQRVAAELAKEFAPLGVEVKWSPKTESQSESLTISLKGAGTEVNIDAQSGSSVKVFNTDGSVKSTNAGITDVVHEIVELHKSVNRALRSPEVRNAVIAGDSSLAKDPYPSQKQVRTAFTDRLPTSYEKELPKRDIDSKIDKPIELKPEQLLKEWGTALKAGDIDRIYVLVEEINRTTTDPAARREWQSKLTAASPEDPNTGVAAKVVLAEKSNDFGIEITHAGKNEAALVLSQNSPPKLIRGKSVLSSAVQPEQFDPAVRSFLDTIPGASVGDRFGAESIKTGGSVKSTLEAAIKLADKVLDTKGTAEIPARFKGIPAEMIPALIRLERLAGYDPKFYDSFTVEDYKGYVKSLERGDLEFIGPELGEKTVRNLRTMLDKAIAKGDPFAQELAKLGDRMKPFDELLVDSATRQAKGATKAEAWRRACIVAHFGLTQEVAIDKNINGIDTYRERLGVKIPMPDVLSIHEIQKRLSLVGDAGSRDAYKILVQAQQFQAGGEIKGSVATLAAETIYLMKQATEIKFDQSKALTIQLAKDALAANKDATAQDLFKVAKFTQEFKDLYSKLPTAEQKVALGNAHTDVEAAKIIEDYVTARATEAFDSNKIDPKERQRWFDLYEAITTKGESGDMVKRLLTRQTVNHVFKQWMDGIKIGEMSQEEVLKTLSLINETAPDLVARMPEGSRERGQFFDSWRNVLTATYQDKSRLGMTVRHAGLNDAEFEFVKALDMHELLKYKDRDYVQDWLKYTLTESRLNSKSVEPHVAADIILKMMVAWEALDQKETVKTGTGLPVSELRTVLNTLHADTIRDMGPEDRAFVNEITRRLILEKAIETERQNEIIAREHLKFAIAAEKPKGGTPQEIEQRAKAAILEARAKKESIPEEVLKLAHASKEKPSQEAIARATRRAEELQQAGERIVDKTVGTHVSNELAVSVLERLSKSDRAVLTQIMINRSPHLSIQGLNSQFEKIAESIRSESAMERATVRGRWAEKITVVCFGNATSGEQLAYLFRKATGVQIEIQNIKSPADLPPGKFLVLDAMPKSGPMADAVNARLLENTAFVPESIQEFHSGLNVFDLARGEVSADKAKDLTNKMVESIKQAKRNHGQPDATPLLTEPIKVSAKEVAKLRRAIGQSINNEIDIMKVESGLYFANLVSAQGRDSLAKAETLASVYEHGTYRVNYAEMMKDAKRLYETKLTAGVDPKDIIFIVDGDFNGSGRFVTRLMRQANGLEGAQFDGMFLTEAEAIAKAKSEGLKGKRIVSVNDCIYSGKTAEGDVRLLQDIARASKNGAPDLVLGSLKGFQEGIDTAGKVAVQKGEAVVRIELGDSKVIQATNQNLVDAVLAHPIRRELKQNVTEWAAKLFGSSEWKDSTVRSRMIYPHMVPNNNSEKMNTFFRLYLGIAGAHSESRFDDSRFDKFGYSRQKGIPRFGYTNENIMRGGRPKTEQSVEELKERGVKYVINLEPSMSDELKGWYEKNGITVATDLSVYPSELTADHLKKVVSRLKELSANDKVFVHCTHGRDRTGAVMAMWRVQEEGMDARSAIAEMHDFGYNPETSGVGKYREFIKDEHTAKTAESVATASKNKVGSGIYLPEKESSEKIAPKYDQARESLGVKGDNVLRNREKFAEFSKQMDAITSGWKGSFGSELPSTLDYLKLSYETYRVVRDDAARELALHEGIEFEEAVERIEDRIRETPNGDSAVHESFKQYERWNTEYGRQLRQVEPIVTERLQQLQKAADDFCRKNDLPEFKLRSTTAMAGANAKYLVGEGTVLLKLEDLLDPEKFEKLASRIYHEGVHYVQDLEVVRAAAQRVTAEQAALGKSNNPADHKELIKARYKEMTGRDLVEPSGEAKVQTKTKAILDRVLDSMKDKPALTEAELARADKLGESFKKITASGSKLAKSETDYLVTDVFLERLEISMDARVTENLVQTLLSPEGKELRQHLFGVDSIEKLPPEIKKHLQNWEQREQGGQWRPFEAREEFMRSLKSRLTDVNSERRQIVQDYLNPLHELESQLIEAEMTEFRAGVLPASNALSGGHKVDHSKPPLERSTQILTDTLKREAISKEASERVSKKSGAAQDAIAKAIEAGLTKPELEQISRLSNDAVVKLLSGDAKTGHALYVKAMQGGYLSPETVDRMLNTDFASQGGRAAADALLKRAMESPGALSAESFRKFVALDPAELSKIVSDYSKVELSQFEKLFEKFPEQKTFQFIEAAKSGAIDAALLSRLRGLPAEAQRSIGILLELRQLGQDAPQIKERLTEIANHNFDFKDPTKADAVNRLASCLESGVVRMGLPLEQILVMPKEARAILIERMDAALKEHSTAIEKAVKPTQQRISLEAEYGKLQACTPLVAAKIMDWKEAAKMVATPEPVLASYLDLISTPTKTPISIELAKAIKTMALDGRLSVEHMRMYTELMNADRLTPAILNDVLVTATGGMEAFNKALGKNLADFRAEELKTGGSVAPLETKTPGRADLERVEMRMEKEGNIETRARRVGPTTRSEEKLFENEIKSLKEAIEVLKTEKRHEEAARLERILKGVERGDPKYHRSVLESARRNRMGMEGLHAGGWLIIASTAFGMVVAANLQEPEKRGGTAVIGSK